ncbi:MAG: bifunctional metallophosphatase/5'-nucleotidase [Syntrophus sp. (in: bacteria)]|nr:bifunctional metallophosphatase/5'-nucleotidase [Syntrophus sp. (in: bacteria)]
MKQLLRQGVTILGVLFLALAVACSGSRPSAYTLSIVHFNDTHSHLEPAAVNLSVNGVKTTARLGGFARIKTALDGMRAQHPDLLLLHGGDAVQGTLYFALFDGTVEYDLLNMLGVDAMTFGNHEFDRGTGPIAGWIGRSRFPWLSANIDFSGEPAIAPKVKPYLIKDIHGEKVAIIGVTTENTPLMTRDVGKAVFNDAVAGARRQVEALTALGVNKIILLSHLGYQQDKALAAQVAGIDIIVGGHSHSLLGATDRLAAIGPAPEGPYPTKLTAPDGKPVLVLQAWQWGHVLGKAHVLFTPDGEIAGYSAGITIPVGEQFVRNNTPIPPESDEYRLIMQALIHSGAARIIPEDPEVLNHLAPYARQVAAYRSVAAATATEDIVRGLNCGPGPLVADSMLAALPGGRTALVNYGGIRRDLYAGAISVGDVLEVMPFGNTLVLVDLTGAELKASLEEGIDFLLQRYPAQNPPAMPYLAGASFSVRPTAAKGARVSTITVKDQDGTYQPVNSGAVYRTVVNAFVAGGGDGFATVKKASGFRSDTGIIDSDAFREYLKSIGSVGNPTEQRIVILP